MESKKEIKKLKISYVCSPAASGSIPYGTKFTYRNGMKFLEKFKLLVVRVEQVCEEPDFFDDRMLVPLEMLNGGGER